jgi:hypothetical protein
LVAIGFLDDMTVRDDKDNNLEGLDNQGAASTGNSLLTKELVSDNQPLMQTTLHVNCYRIPVVPSLTGSQGETDDQSPPSYL